LAARDAFACERSSPAVNELASQRTIIDAGDAIAEPDQDAFAQRLFVFNLHRSAAHDKSLMFRDAQKLFKQWPDLSRSHTMNADIAQHVDSKLVPDGVIKRADQCPEVRRIIALE